jgi:predicted nucleic acid-binding protein
MRQLFVDTSAYFALTDRRDGNHEAAVRIIHQLIREVTKLLTSNYIVAETHTLLLNRIGYKTALQVIEELYKSQTQIYRVREAEERKALEIIRKYTDKEFSLVDAISFATMEKHHLTQAFAFDHHFAQYGFSLQQ